jgi:hypothetical protein
MWWMAIAGAAANQISYLWGANRQRREIGRQESQAQAAYDYRRAYEDRMWGLQRGEALETLGIQSNRLAQSFNEDLAGYNLGLAGQALDNQAARVSLEEGAGMARTAQGASGTRGSDSLDRQIAYHTGMLDRRLDVQDQGNSLAMQSMARQYTNSFADIGREVDSWASGGWRTEAKSLSDLYAQQMHGLEMEGYAHARHEAAPNFLDFMVAGLSGAGTGAQFGAQVDAWRDQGGGGGGQAQQLPYYMQQNAGAYSQAAAQTAQGQYLQRLRQGVR